MGSRDPEAVRRVLEDLPIWQKLVPAMDPKHLALLLDAFAGEDWVRGRTGRCNLARSVYDVPLPDPDLLWARI